MIDAREEKIKILIVEDDIDVIKLLESLLINIEWLEIQSVTSVKDFWKSYKYGVTGGVILDLNLGTGVQDGIDLANKLRIIDQNIFIFVITGYRDVIIDNSELLNSGVDDFLLKPFDVHILRSKLFLMFSRLRRWENMRKLYNVNSKYYENKLHNLKELFNDIKLKIDGGDFSKLEITREDFINGEKSSTCSH